MIKAVNMTLHLEGFYPLGSGDIHRLFKLKQATIEIRREK
jgi:hypothetical protein